MVNVLGFVDHVVFVTMTHLCLCGGKIAKDDM